MEEKWIASVGPHKVDIRKSVRDPRGIEDKVNQAVDKAKEALANNSEAVDGAIDKAADAVQNVAPDQADAAVEDAATKLKENL